MIDIMIPLGKGSTWQDNELRYCLRSVEKHLTGFNRVVIVGELPSWLVGVVHIPAEDLPGNGNRDLNILNKIMLALRQQWITDEILFMNDDHFLLAEFKAEIFPYLYDTTLQKKYDSIKQLNPYRKTMRNTLNILQPPFCVENPPLHFDIHCPVRYSKFQFGRMFERFVFPPHGAGIKSLYCNHAMIGASFQEDDLKFMEPLMRDSIMHALEGRKWFSIGRRCLRGDMKMVLEELFPHKSKFER